MNLKSGDRVVLRSTSDAISQYPECVGLMFKVLSVEQDTKPTLYNRLLIQTPDEME